MGERKEVKKKEVKKDEMDRAGANTKKDDLHNRTY